MLKRKILIVMIPTKEKKQQKENQQEDTVKKTRMVRRQNHIDQYDFILLFLITSYFPQRT
jgi:hypothetical protein